MRTLERGRALINLPTMSAFIVATYNVTDPEGYKPYIPGVRPTLLAHDVEILVADHASESIEGHAGTSTIVLKFESKEAAMAWYNSEEYQAVIHYRLDNTEGSMALVDEFSMPG